MATLAVHCRGPLYRDTFNEKRTAPTMMLTTPRELRETIHFTPKNVRKRTYTLSPFDWDSNAIGDEYVDIQLIFG